MKKILFFLCIPFLLVVTPVFAEVDNGLQEEIIYDILVVRFKIRYHQNSEHVRLADSVAYHGGDLSGVIAKLDYIDQLGFTTIVLSSIMENASQGYHGYWIEDFYSVELQF